MSSQRYRRRTGWATASAPAATTVADAAATTWTECRQIDDSLNPEEYQPATAELPGPMVNALSTEQVGPQQPIDRPMLHELLDTAAQRRVCVVIAAAGWGKTTAVESWVSRRASVWVEPGTDPADAEEFAANLVAALRPHVGVPPAHLPRPMNAAEDRFFGYSAAVCGWLEGSLREDLVLVVDDVHELPRGSGAARLLEGLCRHAPDRLHVVLVSRRELPFSLTRLRGQGLVAEVQAPDLAFGMAEVAALLAAAIDESPIDLVREVVELTAGWPAAVCRATDMLRGVPVEERLAVLDRLVRPGERFHGYLAEEVIGAEPDHVLQLLRRLAVFGAVSPATETTIGVTDATVRLADLARRGLVQRIPGHHERWSLVGPLRDYVDQESVLSTHERAALHRAAAQECASRGAYADALLHSTAAGDQLTCAALLIEHGTALINRGQIRAVLAAANLPPEYLNNPRIQQVLGQARQVRGQSASALECFRRASGDQVELEPTLAWRVGMIAYSQAEFDQVIALPARTRFTGEHAADEARLLSLVATARRMVGDYDGCRIDAERSMALARREADPCALSACHAALSISAAAEGDRRQAEAHCVSAMEAAETGQDLLQVLGVLLLRTRTLGELGMLHAALAEAERAVALGEQCEDAFLYAQALTARAVAGQRLGMLDSALADYTEARDRFQRMGSRFLAWPLCGMGDIYRIRGQLARAQAAYEEALALAEPCHDVVGMASSLIGLAKVRAVDDPVVAGELAERAVALGEGLRHVYALLARGWVAIMTGDRQAASAEAALAAAAARARRDDPGLAEALLLNALSATNPAQRARALGEAIQIWHETGCRVEEAAARLVAHRIGANIPGADPHLAIKTLQECGIDLRTPRPAGPLAVLARWAPSVSIRALGIFQVLRDGAPISRTAWQSKKARQLLKILVARRRPVPREQLMELLWPEADPSKLGNRLSVLLSTLRDVLQPGSDQTDNGPLSTDGSAVWLDHTQIDIDVERFLAQAATALEAHRQNRPDAVSRLSAAETTHIGGFLEDDPYQDWATPLAEEVRATHVALLRALVSRMRETGEVDEVIRYTLRLLDKDHYDEQAHFDLVDVLLAAGRHGEARRRYRIYAKAMNELGIEPRQFPASARKRSLRTG